MSPEVVGELSSDDFPNRDPAMKMLRGLGVLEITREVEDLAELLVAEKVMPEPARSGDALHVAVATLHKMDYLLTWNIQHLANPNKRTHLAVVCLRLGIAPPLILTPDMLQESDNA